jgi:hypothetical protein
MKTIKASIAAIALSAAAPSAGWADGGYWVVGNNQTNTCEIVTSNPVLDVGGPLYFGTGPYNSLKEAKIARSTIGQCPKVADDKDDDN